MTQRSHSALTHELSRNQVSILREMIESLRWHHRCLTVSTIHTSLSICMWREPTWIIIMEISFRWHDTRCAMIVNQRWRKKKQTNIVSKVWQSTHSHNTIFDNSIHSDQTTKWVHSLLFIGQRLLSFIWREKNRRRNRYGLRYNLVCRVHESRSSSPVQSVNIWKEKPKTMPNVNKKLPYRALRSKQNKIGVV